MPAIHMSIDSGEGVALVVCAVVPCTKLSEDGMLTVEQLQKCFSAAKRVVPSFNEELRPGYLDAGAFVLEYLGENARPYCKEILTWEKLPKALSGSVLQLEDGREIYRSRRIQLKNVEFLEL
ncbi:hypothetical protein [[Acidovorax] ebreus]|uniref:hypothetical protein n=1 Tax=Diaphorobacter sp. LI3 TaxID=2952886 RepID=UPI00206A8A91|nr:hypothetical protein MRB47_06965 [Diaphorobacter sp. LI3]